MESLETIPPTDRVDAKLSRVVTWLAMPVGSQTVCRSVGFYPWEMTVPVVSVGNPISRRPATLVRSPVRIRREAARLDQPSVFSVDGRG